MKQKSNRFPGKVRKYFSKSFADRPQSHLGFTTAISKFFRSFSKKKDLNEKSEEVSSAVPCHLTPGVNTSFINEKIRFKVNAMRDDEKYCVVCFDEIRLEKSVEFFDKMEESTGQNGEFDHALVFYIRGLLFEWGVPFCYFLSLGFMNANILKDIITEVIEKLLEIGLIPRVLSCDHSINNRNALTILGASLINTTIMVDNKIIFTCYDVPHLLNSVRNNFMNAKLQILVNGHEVSWSDITAVYELHKRSQISQEMQKISEDHINPTISHKKKVLFAVQLFSKSVAAAIKSAVETNQLKSNTANYTATFVDRMNDIFDALNSNTMHGLPPKKCAMSTSNLIPVEILQEAVDFFTSIQLYNVKQDRRYAYSISGFIWTIKSVVQLWETLQKEKTQYLLTGRLNLNPIENLFSQVHHKNGSPSLPSFEIFRVVLEENMEENVNKPVGSSESETVNYAFLKVMQMDEVPSDYSDYDE